MKELNLTTRLIELDEIDDNIGKIIEEYKFNNILLVYGSGSIKINGVYENVVTTLKKHNIKHLELANVQSNPDISKVREGIDICRTYSIDFILAVGGGSVIDCSKSIANGVFYEGDALDFNKKLAVPQKHLPIGCILTIAAAGAESSNSCVISDRTINFKSGYNGDFNRPLFAVFSPKLTVSVSKFQTACGIVDIISHSFERYFCSSKQFEPADDLALAVIKNVVNTSKVLMKDLNNCEARRAIMIDSTISHNGLTSIFKDTKMVCHYIEHILSGNYPNIAHGAGLAVIMPIWLETRQKSLNDKIMEFGKTVFSIHGVEETIVEFRSFIESLGLPRTFKDLGLSSKEETYYLDLIAKN